MDYQAEELHQALYQVNSMIAKCEKALENQKPGSAQHTLLTPRIKALKISRELMAEHLRAAQDERQA